MSRFVVSSAVVVLAFLSFTAVTLVLACDASAVEPRLGAAELRSGAEAFRRGQLEEAAAKWEAAAHAYESEGRPADRLRALTHLSEAYAALGRYGDAAKALGIALKLAEHSGDSAQVGLVLSRLGKVHAAIGELDTADAYLTRALALARERTDRELIAALLNDIGNVLAARKRYADALTAYRESTEHAAAVGGPILLARALANMAAALQQDGRAAEARAVLDRAHTTLHAAGPSHDASFTLVSVALGYKELRRALPDATSALALQAASVLREAATMSASSGDRRVASYAWGHLGALYEEEQRYPEALELTRRAVFAAQQVNAPESLYRWQWQSGRLLWKMGSTDAAIAAYRRAVATLQSIRPGLLREGVGLALFRETLGPLYFELVDLLLRRADALRTRQAVEPYLIEARDVVELFKVAELRDYFHDDCVDLALSKVTKLDVVAQSAVIIYPILLADRTELLVSLRTGLKRIAVPVGSARLTQEVREFRRKLEKRTTREFLPHAQQLYDWLIRPLEADLEAAKTQTLVFVPDGPLRTIPMAALHDGHRFLITKYALGTTPGLKLTDPRAIDREHTRVLALGVTQAVQGFPALPSVSAELEALRGLFPLTVLVDQDFRVANLERELRQNPFTIVHIASHGQFGGDPQATFLLTFDDKLTMERLDQFIGLFKFRDDPLELLTLSACETAEGDDRAALGLAGVAVRAGARSALATLWTINDPASADLIADFYRELLNPSVSRAVALQRAQVKLLENPRYDHPHFWAPFLLINNWL